MYLNVDIWLLLFLAKFYIIYDGNCHIYYDIIKTDNRVAISRLSEIEYDQFFKKFKKFFWRKSIEFLYFIALYEKLRLMSAKKQGLI